MVNAVYFNKGFCWFTKQLTIYDYFRVDVRQLEV